MSARFPWNELGLDGPADIRAVKRAYAKRLKEIDRDDPDSFSRLRQALEQGKRRASDSTARMPVTSRKAIAEIIDETAGPASAPQIGATPVVLQEPQRETPPKPPMPRQPAPRPPDAQEADLAATQEAAISQLRGQLDAALARWPWDREDLAAALGDALAREPRVFRAAERAIFNSLRKNLGALREGYDIKTAKLVDDYLGWSKDVVGARRRLGHPKAFEAVMHAHYLGIHGGVDPHRKSRAKSRQPQKKRSFWSRFWRFIFYFWLISIAVRLLGGLV